MGRQETEKELEKRKRREGERMIQNISQQVEVKSDRKTICRWEFSIRKIESDLKVL